MAAVGETLFFRPGRNADALEGTITAETANSWIVGFRGGEKLVPKTDIDLANSGWSTRPADPVERWTAQNKKRLVQQLRETTDVAVLKQVADVLFPGEAP